MDDWDWLEVVKEVPLTNEEIRAVVEALMILIAERTSQIECLEASEEEVLQASAESMLAESEFYKRLMTRLLEHLG